MKLLKKIWEKTNNFLSEKPKNFTLILIIFFIVFPNFVNKITDYSINSIVNSINGVTSIEMTKSNYEFKNCRNNFGDFCRETFTYKSDKKIDKVTIYDVPSAYKIQLKGNEKIKKIDFHFFDINGKLQVFNLNEINKNDEYYKNYTYQPNDESYQLVNLKGNTKEKKTFSYSFFNILNSEFPYYLKEDIRINDYLDRYDINKCNKMKFCYFSWLPSNYKNTNENQMFMSFLTIELNNNIRKTYILLSVYSMEKYEIKYTLIDSNNLFDSYSLKKALENLDHGTCFEENEKANNLCHYVKIYTEDSQMNTRIINQKNINAFLDKVSLYISKLK